MRVSENKDWDIIVRPKRSLFRIHLRELLEYTDLIMILVKRDITAQYKQTVLGPVWLFLQPILTTALYTFTFSVSARISTDNIPPILFYLTGLTFWNYFADCFNKTSNTFVANASVFGKVYFPRLVVPASTIISNLAKLGLQVVLLALVYMYYFSSPEIHPQPIYLLMIPAVIIIMGIFGLSLGIFFSSITTKYRDLNFIVSYGVQFLMYLSCVLFPVSIFPQKLQGVLMYNPILTCMETIKYALTGHGSFSPFHFFTGITIVFFTFIFSVIIFNRTEKNFMDTV